MRLLAVVGARPNIVKVAPIVRATEARGFDVTIVHTGQHYDAALSADLFVDLGMRAPDHDLGIGSGSHADQTAGIIMAFDRVVDAIRPDVTIVVGDANSTLATALVAAKKDGLLAHVEAGLRSRDRTMPEEINRIVVDHLSDLLFAPSEDAVANLHTEGVPAEQVHLVGNVMIDSLLTNLERARMRPILAELGLEQGGYAFATLHRPSNVDDPAVLRRLLDALATVGERLPVVFSAHPRASAAIDRIGTSPGIRVLPPMGYLDAIALQAASAMVLTDSGGLQEESTVLGVPCLTIRETTERPITVSEGTNRIVGTDPGAIVEAARAVLDAGGLDDGAPARRPELWDGKAAERIADVLEQITH